MTGSAAMLHTPVRIYRINQNRKLSPVVQDVSDNGHPRIKAQRPYAMCTYVSIAATCPSSCEFKDNGCYASEGFAKQALRAMDGAAHKGRFSADVVTQMEATWLDELFKRSGVPQDGGRCGTKGRDLRLHVGGDVSSAWGARQLAAAVERLQLRGCGTAWTYTKRWRSIHRSAWGPIRVLASVSSVDDAHEARAQGYAPAIVVAQHNGPKLYTLREGKRQLRVIPCPAEAGSTTCVQCRLCLDRDLHKLGVAIGFEAHGIGAAKVRLALLPKLPGLQHA